MDDDEPLNPVLPKDFKQLFRKQHAEKNFKIPGETPTKEDNNNQNSNNPIEPATPPKKVFKI